MGSCPNTNSLRQGLLKNQFNTILCYIVFTIILYSSMLCIFCCTIYSAIRYIIPYYIIWHYNILYCTTLYAIIYYVILFYYIILHDVRLVLYYIVISSPRELLLSLSSVDIFVVHITHNFAVHPGIVRICRFWLASTGEPHKSSAIRSLLDFAKQVQ